MVEKDRFMNSENEILKKDVTQLAKELLTQSDPCIRRQIAEELGSYDCYTSIAALSNALKDDNKGVRDAAQRSLLNIGNEHVARTVVDYLLDTNIITRNAASEILIKLGTKSINAVLPYLFDADHDVRKFAVDILGFIGDESPSEQLLPLLNDPDPNVVISVVEALGNMKATKAVKDLINTYQQSDEYKAAVVEALGKIGGDEASDFLLQKYCEQILEPSKDPLLTYTLLEALSVVGNKKALSILRQQVGTLKGQLNHLLLHAIIQISKRGNGAEIDWYPYKEYLLEALNANEVAIRISAIRALNTIQDNNITRHFLLALGKDETVDSLLQSILPSRSQFLVILVDVMEEGEFILSKSLLLVLQQYIQQLTYARLYTSFLESEAIVLPKLSALLGQQWDSADEEMRPLLIDILFRLDGDHAVEFLSGITEYPDPWLKMQVIELLAPVSDKRAAEFLFRFLNDEDEMVRQMVGSILSMKGYSGETTPASKAEV